MSIQKTNYLENAIKEFFLILSSIRITLAHLLGTGRYKCTQFSNNEIIALSKVNFKGDY